MNWKRRGRRGEGLNDYEVLEKLGIEEGTGTKGLLINGGTGKGYVSDEVIFRAERRNPTRKVSIGEDGCLSWKRMNRVAKSIKTDQRGRLKSNIRIGDCLKPQAGEYRVQPSSLRISGRELKTWTQRQTSRAIRKVVTGEGKPLYKKGSIRKLQG